MNKSLLTSLLILISAPTLDTQMVAIAAQDQTIRTSPHQATQTKLETLPTLEKDQPKPIQDGTRPHRRPMRHGTRPPSQPVPNDTRIPPQPVPDSLLVPTDITTGDTSIQPLVMPTDADIQTQPAPIEPNTPVLPTNSTIRTAPPTQPVQCRTRGC